MVEVNGGYQCKFPLCSEKKQLKHCHIGAACSKTELLRDSAHHKVRSVLTALFRVKCFEIYGEVRCEIQDDDITQNRRADIIIVVDRRTNWCWSCTGLHHAVGDKMTNDGTLYSYFVD